MPEISYEFLLEWFLKKDFQDKGSPSYECLIARKFEIMDTRFGGHQQECLQNWFHKKTWTDVAFIKKKIKDSLHLISQFIQPLLLQYSGRITIIFANEEHLNVDELYENFFLEYSPKERMMVHVQQEDMMCFIRNGLTKGCCWDRLWKIERFYAILDNVTVFNEHSHKGALAES